MFRGFLVVSEVDIREEENQRIPSLFHPEGEARDVWEYTDTNAPAGPSVHRFMMILAVFVPLLGFVAAVITAGLYGWIGWVNFVTMCLLFFLTGMGITVGYHRLLAHKSFETFGWMRAFWMMMGALALQKSPVEWCAVHRRHHALSDRAGDPHSPHLHDGGFWNAVRGFWFSHIGWLFTGYLIYTDHRRYVPDLAQDRIALWIHRYYEVIWIPLSFALPALIGGVGTQSWLGAWLGLFWGGFVRAFIVHHVTWSINSICHIYGTQDFDVNDQSKNNIVFGLLGFGEGWHNNHHAFPSSARHGLKWWQFDLSWIIIRAMQCVGLAWDVKTPSPDKVRQKYSQPAEVLEGE